MPSHNFGVKAPTVILTSKTVRKIHSRVRTQSKTPVMSKIATAKVPTSNAETTVIMGAMRMKRMKGESPAQNNIGMANEQKTIAVPRSGSLMMSKAGTKTMAKTMAMSLYRRKSVRSLEANLASARIVA